MSKTKELSASMVAALAFALEHGGRLERFQGGYWSYPECPRDRGLPTQHLSTPTMEALVKRGYLQYVDWRQGKKRKFPIAARPFACTHCTSVTTVLRDRSDGMRIVRCTNCNAVLEELPGENDGR